MDKYANNLYRNKELFHFHFLPLHLIVFFIMSSSYTYIPFYFVSRFNLHQLRPFFKLVAIILSVVSQQIAHVLSWFNHSITTKCTFFQVGLSTVSQQIRIFFMLVQVQYHSRLYICVKLVWVQYTSKLQIYSSWFWVNYHIQLHIISSWFKYSITEDCTFF